MVRRIAVLVVALVAFGCGASGPSIAGTWKGKAGDQPLTFVAQPDGAFDLIGNGKMQGRWEASGHDIKLYRDISQGGDAPFGSVSDEAMHLTLSADGKQLTGTVEGSKSYTLTKQ